MKAIALLAVCTVLLVTLETFGGDKPSDTQGNKSAMITTNSSVIVNITGLQLPEQPKFQLPYQTRGTRTDMGPKIVLEQPKTNQCKYTPTREELKAYADNAEKLQGSFGPLFLGRQVQLNQEWDKKQREAEAACNSGQKPPPLAIMPAEPTKK